MITCVDLLFKQGDLCIIGYGRTKHLAAYPIILVGTPEFCWDRLIIQYGRPKEVSGIPIIAVVKTTHEGDLLIPHCG